MGRIIVFLLLCFQLTCIASKAEDMKMDTFIDNLMAGMTVEEKIGQLNLSSAVTFTATGPTVGGEVEKKTRVGYVGGILNSPSLEIARGLQEIAVNESPHKIPLITGMDVIHGHKTIFPIPLALSCTWDMGLIEKSARIAAVEASASGISWTFSPMVDIARDPRWGRIAEGAGEDAWLGSQVARAMVRGYQGDDLTREDTILACVKHFALYGAAEAGRDYNTVDMSRLQMYQDYLPPYKAAVGAGAGSVMTSFNVVDRIPASGNRWLMTELLRSQWGFDGFVVTDYTAVNEMQAHGLGDLKTVSALALNAGSDMDMVGEGYLTTLKQSLVDGAVSMDLIDRACRRILEAKYKLGLFDDPYRYLNPERAAREVLTDENMQAAREIASRSFVLLKNANQTLPLKKTGTLAVIGPLADSKSDMLGTWAINGDRERVVTILEGIRNAAEGKMTVLHARGAPITIDPFLKERMTSPLEAFFGGAPQAEDTRSAEELMKEALTVAGKADVIVAVLGETSGMSGESASRSNIDIPESQKDLLKALVGTGKPVVLVLVNGRPLTLTWEDENVDAILETWAGGTQTGNAVADVVFGDVHPSGKLTATFPRNVGQIPLYYNHLNTGRPLNQESPRFTSCYIDVPNSPLYPFGYGLSYTKFEYGDISVSKNTLTGDDTLSVAITLTNSGKFAGEEVVQLYISDPVASLSRPVKELKGFQKILLKPGEKRTVEFTVTTDDLKFFNSDLVYDWEPGEFIIHIGPNSRDVQSIAVNWFL